MVGIGASSLGAIQNPGSPSGRLESLPAQGTFSRQPSPKPTAGIDRGLWITLRAIRRQLTAMPHDLFLIRLIHHATRRPFPGERLWTATQLLKPATVRFLRVRNREGCDVYIWPYAENYNAGYILLDLDRSAPSVLEAMWANGHDPCVVVQTSPGHLQAWIHVSTLPLEPALATALGRYLAHIYGGDRASTDWRHLGRLAGFINQKPRRYLISGSAPWVKILEARPLLATAAQDLLHSARQAVAQHATTSVPDSIGSRLQVRHPSTLTAQAAARIYRSWMERWRIRQRFPRPDWSTVDLWLARKLLAIHIPPLQVQTILRLGSPDFPRQHGDPEDYLRRTLAGAALPTPRAVCSLHASSPPSPQARDPHP